MATTNLIVVLNCRVIIASLFDDFVNGRRLRGRLGVVGFFVVVDLFVMFVTFGFGRDSSVFLLAAFLSCDKFDAIKSKSIGYRPSKMTPRYRSSKVVGHYDLATFST